MFCSAECMESNDLHNKFCGASYNHRSGDILLEETVLMAACAFPNADSLTKFVERALATRDLDAPQCESSAQIKYRLFLKLLASPKDISEVRQEIFEVYGFLLEIPFIVQFFRTDQEKRFLMHLIGQHLRILRRNAFSSVHPNGKVYMTTIGICSSLFNHSCEPNILNTSFGNKTIGYVQRAVKKGEQLFIHYFQGEDITASAQKVFNFQCKCSKCVPRWKQEDRNRIQMDPDFQLLARVPDEDFKNHKTLSVLKAKVKSLLAKYGRLPWSPELKKIEYWYRNCCVEESPYVDYCISTERETSIKHAMAKN